MAEYQTNKSVLDVDDEAVKQNLQAAKVELHAAKAKRRTAKGHLTTAEAQNDPVNVAKAELGVLKAELEVDEAELEMAKQCLQAAEARSDPVTIAEAKVAVAEAKVAVVKREVAVAEAKVAVAKREVADAEADGKSTAKAVLDRAIQGLKLAQTAYEQALAGTWGGAATNRAAESGAVLQQLQDLIQDMGRLRGIEEDMGRLRGIAEDMGQLKLTVDDMKNAQGPASTPTPATVGRIAHMRLVSEKKWIRIQQEGAAVLTDEESQQLKAEVISVQSNNTGIRREWALVAGLTPRLRELVAKAAEKIQTSLVFVNSERHFWAVDPYGGASTAPDFFITHPSVWKENTTDVDRRVDASGFCFGLLETWDCRDCIEVLGECKVEMGPNDFSALGEGLNYLGRIACCGKFSEHRNVRIARIQSGRVVVFDWDKFYLVHAVNGYATDCKHGLWTDPGSVEAVVDFIGSTVDRAWTSALKDICKKASVQLVLPGPGSNSSCVLGSGAYGRVFRATDEIEGCVALKIALDQRGIDAISSEKDAYEKEALAKADATTTMIRHVQDKGSSGLVIRPLGVPLPKTVRGIKSALFALLKLSRQGLKHGDARISNVIWIETESRALWTDMHTLRELSEGELEEEFVSEVMTLALSLGVTVDTAKLREEALAVRQDPEPMPNLQALVDIFKIRPS